MFVISARLAPLPPSSARMSAFPSAFPAPKKYTYLLAELLMRRSSGGLLRGLPAGNPLEIEDRSRKPARPDDASRTSDVLYDQPARWRRATRRRFRRKYCEKAISDAQE